MYKKILITRLVVVIGGLCLIGGCKSDSSSPYGSTPTQTSSSGSGQPNTVVISGFAFNPSTITVPKGTTVTWRNDDGVMHTSTSDSGVWNTGDIAPGTTKTAVFNTSGTFPFHCLHHYMMTGSIIVQ
jgi:plastocyanin